jgi:hypothetical protein
MWYEFTLHEAWDILGGLSCLSDLILNFQCYYDERIVPCSAVGSLAVFTVCGGGFAFAVDEQIKARLS